MPIIFVFLRVWGTARFLMNVNSNAPTGGYFFLQLLQVACLDAQWWRGTHGVALMVWQNIGDSGQGFANAVLYCVFTKRVRDHFLLAFRL